MKRLIALAALAILPLSSCSSGDDEIVDQPTPLVDAGSDTSISGGTSGFGGASGFGGSASGASGSGSGTLGSGGSGATGGEATGGAAGGGTCNPSFCPNNGMGTPCCVVPGQGPCGFDQGFGCQGMPPNDF